MVERPFVWTCNTCHKSIPTQQGFPTGWVWYGNTLKTREIKHACKECKGIIDEPTHTGER